MIEQYAQSLVHFLQANPNWGGLLAFFIAFLESLVLIGTIVPGSIAMTAIGMLIGASILPFGMTILFATLGAFLGDLFGYWLGSHYNERLRNWWPFKTRPQWLEAGENFFHKHGGKSILIGRFMGPLRSIIPLIAGLLHMPWQRFTLAAIPTACLWAITYMLPGILLGALSLQLPPSVATKFILIFLLLIIGITFFAWLINIFSGKIKKIIKGFLKRTWQKLRSQRRFDWLTRLIAIEDQPDNYLQLGWLIVALISFLLFIIIAISVYEHNWLTSFNRPIFEFLRSVRNVKIDQAMIGLTLLGDGRVLLISSVFIIGWLLWFKNKRAAWHWFLAIMIAILVPHLFKYTFYFPRPTGLLHASSMSSFPSGHTFSSVIYYGFLGTIVATYTKTRFKHYCYYLACSLILLVAFSRVYLGTHWLTDILASLSIGYTFLALLTLSYRRKVLLIKILHFLMFTIIVTFIVWSLFFVLNYKKNVLRYSLDWPSQLIDEDAWWGRLNSALPTYRKNRIGEPDEPMNVQYFGDMQYLKKILAMKGWIVNPNMTLIKTTIHKLSENKASIVPLLPSLYLNRPPVLFMMKENAKKKLLIKLWVSNIYMTGSWDVLYIGTITEYQINSKHKIKYTFNAITKLLPYLNKDDWRVALIKADQIPHKLFKQKWNGEILQISAPTLY